MKIKNKRELQIIAVLMILTLVMSIYAFEYGEEIGVLITK
jgi:hypothetical protein